MSQPTPPAGPVPHGPPGSPAFLQPLESGDLRRVGRYELLGRLGAGGMGRVFLGRSPGGRLVAVKLIHRELAADAAFRARFGREVAAARRVGGMFTAPVVDADPLAAQPWLVTGYVPGPSLAEVVARQGPLPVTSVLALAASLAEGLEAVHAAGVVHRDLKPSNVLLASDGPRIIDFGISRAADGTAVTGTGQVIGSPGFMSPEQADGREVGTASDVFSLGSVLAFAATGQGPFGTGPATALLYRVVHAEPATAGLPSQVRPLVERCLAKDPGQRPTTGQLLTRGHTAADRRAELQIIHEMERRDRAAEEARRHHEAVLLARAGRQAEREAEYERIKRAAEAATQGYLVTRQGQARGITDHEIFTGRQAIFDRYASEEARNYFLDHHRPTAAYFRGQDTRVTGRYTERKRQARRPPSYRPIKLGKGRTVNVAVVPKQDRAGQRPASH